MTTTEIVAVFFGVACVWLTIRQNIWCWPTGLIQVVLFIVIFYDAKLYSDMLLHMIYVGMQLYGWYVWSRPQDSSRGVSVTRLRRIQFLGWVTAIAIGTASLGAAMATYTDAALPYADAFTTVGSLCAQWLLARKRLESWWIWIAVDVVAIGVYSLKELYLTAGLYTLFLGMAVAGYFVWRNSLPVSTAKASA